MASTDAPRVWAVLPTSLRSAGIVALATSLLASALLFQTNVRSARPPTFSRGGAFEGNLANPAQDLSLQTPSVPTPTGSSRSSAVLSAPADPEGSGGGEIGPPLPAIGKYVYSVDGTESATAFGSRRYPAEMTMTVHRSQGAGEPSLKDDELAFDLDFSQDHEEREIAAYRAAGILFTYEAGSVTFGPVTRTSEATYHPPMMQIPVPLERGKVVMGTTKAVDPQGSVSRTEDWTVTVYGLEQVAIMGKLVDAWVVEIKRQSRPGSRESVTRSRKYWFDARRSIWVKWEEHMVGSQRFGPGSFTYTTDFTATLKRLEPL